MHYIFKLTSQHKHLNKQTTAIHDTKCLKQYALPFASLFFFLGHFRIDTCFATFNIFRLFSNKQQKKTIKLYKNTETYSNNNNTKKIEIF